LQKPQGWTTRLKDDWFEEVLSPISKGTGISPAEVKRFWMDHSYFTTTLLYVHLGSLDKITIVADEDEGRIETERIEINRMTSSTTSIRSGNLP